MSYDSRTFVSDGSESSLSEDCRTQSGTLSHLSSYNTSTSQVTSVSVSHTESEDDSFMTDSNSGQLITISNASITSKSDQSSPRNVTSPSQSDRTTVSYHTSSSHSPGVESEKSESLIRSGDDYSSRFEPVNHSVISVEDIVGTLQHQLADIKQLNENPLKSLTHVDNSKSDHDADYSSNFPPQTNMEETAGSKYKAASRDDAVSKQQSITPDYYSSDFDDVSQTGSQRSSISKSQTHSEENYSSNFDATSERLSHSSRSLTSKVYSIDYTSYQYSSDGFESSDTSSLAGDSSKSGHSSRGVQGPSLTPEQLQQELLYCKEARRILAGNSGDKKKKSRSEIPIIAPIPQPPRKMKNYGPINKFIASSLANIRESTAQSEGRREPLRPVSYLDELAGKRPPVRTLPAHHSFVSQAERLRLENVITSMKQTSQKLSDEIKEHEKVATRLRGDQNGREFALPRKIRLQRAEFTSKLENHQTVMNSVNMIGMIASELPRPTDDPEIIWHKLMSTAARADEKS